MLRYLLLEWPAQAVDRFGRFWTIVLAALTILCFTNVLLALLAALLPF